MPKFEHMEIPFKVITAVGMLRETITPNINGWLIHADITLSSNVAFATDMPVTLEVDYNRGKTALSIIPTSYVASSDDDARGQGVVWHGRLPVDDNTRFLVHIYNRSGLTQRLSVGLVFEHEL